MLDLNHLKSHGTILPRRALGTQHFDLAVLDIERGHMSCTV